MAPEYAELVELLIDGARYGDAEDVNQALEHSVDVNAQDEQGRTALHMAAANGHCEVMQILLDHGANVGLANEEGNTALHWACLNGQEQAVRLLMESGASPSALNRYVRGEQKKHEQTPVDEAFSRGFQSVVDVINSFAAPSRAPDGVGEEEEEEGGSAEGVIDMEAELGGEGAANPGAEERQ